MRGGEESNWQGGKETMKRETEVAKRQEGEVVRCMEYEGEEVNPPNPPPKKGKKCKHTKYTIIDCWKAEDQVMRK